MTDLNTENKDKFISGLFHLLTTSMTKWKPVGMFSSFVLKYPDTSWYVCSRLHKASHLRRHSEKEIRKLFFFPDFPFLLSPSVYCTDSLPPFQGGSWGELYRELPPWCALVQLAWNSFRFFTIFAIHSEPKINCVWNLNELHVTLSLLKYHKLNEF